MPTTLRQPLGNERSEVFDVAGDHSPVLGTGDSEDDHVAATDQVRPIGYSLHVEAAVSKLLDALLKYMLDYLGSRRVTERCWAAIDSSR